MYRVVGRMALLICGYMIEFVDEPKEMPISKGVC